MLSTNMITMLNAQINKEFYSAYLYQEFANYYGEVGLDGFQNWFNVQAKEELAHGMLFINYLLDNGAKVDLKAIEDPSQTFVDFKAPLTAALEHEKEITKSINALYECAVEDKDYRSQQILDWFVKEQYEEEINASDLITRYELFGEDKRSLWEINNELKNRSYSEPNIDM